MLIELVDPSGTGLGLAIGLRQLGHDVVYVEAHSHPPAVGETARRMRREVVAQSLGDRGGRGSGGRGLSVRVAGAEPDLLVLVDVFGDYLHCLETGIGEVGEVEAADPLQANAGAMVYPLRLRYFVERAQLAGQVAVVDMSDRRGLRESSFEAIGGASLFAREAVASGEGAWRPFPFLYNLATLWLECVQEPDLWLAEARKNELDWVFCGTLRHERYGDRRVGQVAEVARRWPRLRGAVYGDRSFGECVARLQTARFGLDLAGCGDLCFRVHECLALGTPVWQPFASPLALPEGLRSVVVAQPDENPGLDSAAVREVYAEHYAPVAAARWLLAGCSATCSRSRLQSASPR